jgi:hypothetical protein
MGNKNGGKAKITFNNELEEDINILILEAANHDNILGKGSANTKKSTVIQVKPANSYHVIVSSKSTEEEIIKDNVMGVNDKVPKVVIGPNKHTKRIEIQKIKE